MSRAVKSGMRIAKFSIPRELIPLPMNTTVSGGLSSIDPLKAMAGVCVRLAEGQGPRALHDRIERGDVESMDDWPFDDL